MKKNLWSAALAVTLLAIVPASAQTAKLRANVPFNFIVDGSTYPAGNYSFESVGNQGGVLAIRSAESQKQSNVLVNQDASSLNSSETKLLFHRYGDQYFLTELQVARNYMHLPVSKWEKEMAKTAKKQSNPMREVALEAATN